MIFSTLGFTGTAKQAAGAPLPLQTDPQAGLALNDFGPISASAGWAWMGGGLYWTDDHGANWRDITPALPKAAQILSVTFLDDQHGRVLWEEPQTSGDLALRLNSTFDEGLTWLEGTVQLLPASDLDTSIKSARMDWLDSETGWVLLQRQTGSNFSAGTLFHTTDGGQTWVRRALPAAGEIRFADAQAGWLAGGPGMDQLFQTADAGQTWHAAALPDELEAASVVRLYPPVFDPSGNGLLAAITQAAEAFTLRFYSTSNAGAAWRRAAEFPLGAQAGSLPLTLLDPLEAVATFPGSDQILRLRQGQPETLTNTDGLSAGIIDLKMVSPEAGWAEWNESTCTKTPSSQDGLTDITCTAETKLLSTEDGGVTWTALRLPGIDAETLVQTSTTTSGNPSPLRAAAFTNTQVFIGKGFDICGVPALTALNIWDDYSPYASMNLYIGGDMLYDGCYRSYLNSAYLVAARDYGWTFIPTWVGPQAPCTSYNVRISSDPANQYAAANTQGVNEAKKALDALAMLGLTTPAPDKKGSVVYYDLETFAGDQACRDAVKSFMNGWDYQLTLSQTASGLYASTGCTNGLNNYISIPYPPFAIWGALWDYHDTVWNMGCIPNTEWDTHQRIHQYEGAHNESWGPTGQKVTLNIDSNAMDSIVAVPNQVIVPPPPSAAFSASPTSGSAPLAVTFHITNYAGHQADYVTCAWVYGDGQTGTTCTDHIHTYDQTGVYTVTLTVQGPGGTDDLTKTDYIVATEPLQPDLVPFPRVAGADPVIISSSAGTHVNDTLFVNQPVFIDWGYKNIGNADIASDFQVDLFIDDERIADFTVAGLNKFTPGGFTDTSITWYTSSWHTVRLVVDPENTVPESNEDNNTWSGQFYWVTNIPMEWPGIIAPTGIIYTNRPDFIWAVMSNVSYFRLEMTSLTPGGVFFSYPPLTPECLDPLKNKSVCIQTSNSILPPGDYQFRVGVMNLSSVFTWSPWQVFTVYGLPPTPINLTPTGNVADPTPTFTWKKMDSSSWYELYVYPVGSETPVVSETSIQALASCTTSLCSWTPSLPIDAGPYILKVRGANLSGVSDYGQASFTETTDYDAYIVYIPMMIH